MLRTPYRQRVRRIATTVCLTATLAAYGVLVMPQVALAAGSAPAPTPQAALPAPSTTVVLPPAPNASVLATYTAACTTATADTATTVQVCQQPLVAVSGTSGSGASLAANSSQLDTGTVIYQAYYFPNTWAGELSAFAVDPETGVVNPTATWKASTEMPPAAARNIVTYNPAGSTQATTFPAFANDATTGVPKLNATELSALGSTTTQQAAIVNYLRGNATNEVQNGGLFRTRTTPLGDIIDSQPVYAGAPDFNEFLGQEFAGNPALVNSTNAFVAWAVGTFDTNGNLTASAASQRTPMLYVAANDGMLHAFNAGANSVTLANGTVVPPGGEVFAYLPGAVITAGIADLARPDYGTPTNPHQDYNDGQLTIADAYVQLSQTGDTSPQWHTILVGTTGRGSAKAVYALDVTNPLNITPLWERSAGDGQSGSSYIGQMVGKPVIAQVANGVWAVLIGNGYNSTAGTAALLQFNLASGTLYVHATNSTTANGLAAPVAWQDSTLNADGSTDGVSIVAYAGDLKGNVWSFALGSASTSAGALLFTAKDSSGNVQPITAGLLAGQQLAQTSGSGNGNGRGNSSATPSYNQWLFFGTGRMLSYADVSPPAGTNFQTQTWYGIIVQSGSSSSPAVTSSTGRCASSTSTSCLVQRTVQASTSGSGTTLPTRTVSSASANDMTNESGWYLDLPTSGERMTDPNQFQGNLLLGITRIPNAQSPNVMGWIMAVDPFTGAAASNNFFDVNGDGYINSSDAASGVGFTSLPNAPIFVGGTMETSLANGTIRTTRTSGSTGGMVRTSWREVVN